MLRNLEENLASTIVSSIGTMISIGLNLTPILLFYRYFKKTAGIETIPESMFITGIFCCATNLAYGIIKGDVKLEISNGVCYGLQVLYGTTYIFIANNKQIDKLLLYLIIAWDLSFEVLFIFGNILEVHFDKEFALWFTGIFNTVIGALNVITPGQNIIKVCRTGNFTLIPIVTIFFQCACSSLWFIYGLSDLDVYLIVPNLLGMVLTAIQISVYYYFYIKNHGIPPHKEEDKDENTETNDSIQSGMDKINDSSEINEQLIESS